jgi:hypothetical protein
MKKLTAREQVVQVSRPDDPKPSSKDSKLARTAAYKQRRIDEEPKMYSDKNFGLTKSLIDAVRGIVEKKEASSEVKKMTGGKTKVDLNPETVDKITDVDDNRSKKAMQKEERDSPEWEKATPKKRVSQVKKDLKSINGNEGHDLQKEEAEDTTPRNEKERKLASLAAPKNKITHKDVLVGRGVIKEKKCDKCGMDPCKCKHVKEEVVVTEATSGYRIYHPQYSQAVQHALHHHNQKHGLTHDEDDYHQKITHGPRKPAEGETRTHNILAYDKNGKEHVIHMQIYNRGGEHSPYELNTYHSKVNKKLQKEETEKLDERNKENKLKKDIFVTKLGMKKEPWYKTHEEVQLSNDELANLAAIAELFDEGKKKEKGVPSQTTIGSAPTRGANQDQSGFNPTNNVSDYTISD